MDDIGGRAASGWTIANIGDNLQTSRIIAGKIIIHKRQHARFNDDQQRKQAGARRLSACACAEVIEVQTVKTRDLLKVMANLSKTYFCNLYSGWES